MKTVDENYSYNELEGFQAVDLKRTRGDAKELWVLFGNKHISLSQAAREIICTTEYLQFFYNPETRQLLMAAAPAPGKNTTRINKTIRFTGFACIELVRLIEQETRRDLGTVRLRFSGKKVKSKRSAIIFDLASMEVVKSKPMPKNVKK